MKLSEVRIRNYRCIIDSGWFSIEDKKTILVGKNESGKTVILRALQHLNRGKEREKISELEDYPRHLYSEDNDPNEKIISAKFKLEDHDLALLSDFLESMQIVKNSDVEFIVDVCLNSEQEWEIVDFNDNLTFLIDGIIVEFASSLYEYIDDTRSQYVDKDGNGEGSSIVTFEDLKNLDQIAEELELEKNVGKSRSLTNVYLKSFLDLVRRGIAICKKVSQKVNEIQQHPTEITLEEVEFLSTIDSSIHRIETIVEILEEYVDLGKKLFNSLPQFVFFNKYHEIDSEIRVDELLDKKNNGVSNELLGLGNLNLIKALGFTLEELSELGKDISLPNSKGIRESNKKKKVRKQKLDKACRELTKKINDIWKPEYNGSEACNLKVSADGQLLRFEVCEGNDIWIEFGERSDGYKWLVSFYITLIAEVEKSYQNAIFLLDEPGLSLHGSKQIQFRDALSSLGETNQTIFTTHSPFLVGPRELDMVRIVELKEKEKGTKVHKNLWDGDRTSRLPLQVALGFNLSSSMHLPDKNFVVEGYTDYQYILTTAKILEGSKKVKLDDAIRIVIAGKASFVTLLVALLFGNELKVGVLLDSDDAGNNVAKKDELVKMIGNENILQVGNFLEQSTKIKGAEIEDMLRDTLTDIVSEMYPDKDLRIAIEKRSNDSIAKVLKDTFGKDEFSKANLVEAYKEWTRKNDANKLSEEEVEQWKNLIEKMNQVME